MGNVSKKKILIAKHMNQVQILSVELAFMDFNSGMDYVTPENVLIIFQIVCVEHVSMDLHSKMDIASE